jgi:cellulose synthase/poly-beta-1,6-N-acetylglucosamine synthase-like glycosyltransferase
MLTNLTPFQALLLSLYVPMSLVLAVYGLHRVHMVFGYLRARRRNPRPEGRLKELPSVLVQVPVFNERAVVRRVLEAVARLDYPRDRLTVQLLDDSTDDTVEIGAQVCAELQAAGLQVEHVRRESREGFKAGALAHGLERDDAELVAIFDADFVPPPHFLRTVVPYFAKPRVGMVQARWDHLNLQQNLLTRLQSFFIDGHFILEHTYRHRTGRFFNFNGTAGIWRRECIDDAGGWSASSITEDTEISFRAYVKGWEFVYLRDLTVPAELPADVEAYKGQQHRWAKGYTEVLRQHLGTIWRAPIAFKAKVEATLMLSNHFAFLLFGAITILHLPLVLVRSSYYASPALKFLDILGINLVLLAFFAFYVVSQWEAKRFTPRRLALIPLVLGIGMAQMVNSSRAVLEALFGVRTGFVRTPKGGERPDPGYKAKAAVRQALAEVGFGIYLLLSCVLLIGRGHAWGVPLNLVVAFGFLYLGLGTLRKHWHTPAREPERKPAPASAGV